MPASLIISPTRLVLVLVLGAALGACRLDASGAYHGDGGTGDGGSGGGPSCYYFYFSSTVCSEFDPPPPTEGYGCKPAQSGSCDFLEGYSSCEPSIGCCYSMSYSNVRLLDECPSGCLPDCESSECGGDGCGGSCGECQGSDVCQGGQCVPCTPKCDGKSCGPDLCGGVCGTCNPGETCDDGSCDCPCAHWYRRCGEDGSLWTCETPCVEKQWDCDTLCAQGGYGPALGCYQGACECAPNPFTTATAIVLNAPAGSSGVLNAAGERNYYQFEGTAGSWIEIMTVANAGDDPQGVDTVISVYDATRTRLAENDDGLPRASPDSHLVLRLPTTGTYYVVVQDYTTWAGQTPAYGPSFAYTLYVDQLVLPLEGVVVDQEPANDPAHAIPLPASSGWVYILGGFEGSTDVDVFSFQVPAGDVRQARFCIMPAGPAGDGATTPVGQIYVTDAAGAQVIGRIDGSIAGGPTELAAPLMSGTYLLWIRHPNTAAGANDFYVVKHYLGPTNPPEREAAGATGANDTIAQAAASGEAITLADLGGGERSGFVLAHLPVGDVDYFAFAAAAGDSADVMCAAATLGSGLRWLNVSVRGADDVALASATESATARVSLEGVSIAAAGTYYLRLASEGQDPTVTGTYAQCGLYLSAP